MHTRKTTNPFTIQETMLIKNFVTYKHAAERAAIFQDKTLSRIMKVDPFSDILLPLTGSQN